MMGIEKGLRLRLRGEDFDTIKGLLNSLSVLAPLSASSRLIEFLGRLKIKFLWFVIVMDESNWNSHGIMNQAILFWSFIHHSFLE